MLHIVWPRQLASVVSATPRPETSGSRDNDYILENLAPEGWAQIQDGLSRGDDLIVIGIPPEEQLKWFWLEAYDPEAGVLSAMPSLSTPFDLPDLTAKPASCRGTAWKPPKPIVFHGVDEEPRADLVPLYEAVDQFGEAVAWPAVMIRHTAPTLMGGRFGGGRWCFFLWDEPLGAFDLEGWRQIIDSVTDYLDTGVQITKLSPTYASYQASEPVAIGATLLNRNPRVASAILRAEAVGPDGEIRTIGIRRYYLSAGEQLNVRLDWQAPDSPGLWRIRAKLYLEDYLACGLGREDEARYVESSECGIVVTGGGWPASTGMGVEGARITLDGRAGFWTGTHYYPSSAWWDWLWRDLSVTTMDRDLAAMRRSGLRWVRLWIDPELDETSLRAMDAAIHLCGVHGLVPIVTIFTQWARWLSFTNERGEWVRFQFMGWRDQNVYSVSLMDMALQQEYVGVLARQWKDVPNVVWNLSNENYLVAPDESQMDPDLAALPGLPESEPARSQALTCEWASRLITALRGNGAMQPVSTGYTFPQSGGTYATNAVGEIVPWHDYGSPAEMGKHLLCLEPTCRNQPMILEEFAACNEEIMYQALAGHAQLACSYEWGISRLAPALPYVPTPIKDCSRVEDPDDRWFGGVMGEARTWPDESMGLAPWAGGFYYGTIRHGTPFAKPMMRPMAHVALLEDCAGYVPAKHSVYVMMPLEFGERKPFEGWPRKLARAEALIDELWGLGVIFGVWQEDHWQTLPESTRMVIFPCEDRDRPEARRMVEAWQSRGIEIWMGDDQGWKRSSHLKRVEVTAGAQVKVACRDLQDGALYVLWSEGLTAVAMQVGDHRVDMGLDRFGLVMVRNEQVSLIEGAGEIRLDGKRFCTVDGSRVMIRSADGSDVRQTPELLISAVGQANVEFARKPVKAEALRDTRRYELPVGDALAIDQALSGYVIDLHFD